MELPLIVVMPITAAADRSGSVTPAVCMRKRSASMMAVPARLTRMNVRRPAEWRLLERSQPMMAANAMLSASRRRIDLMVRSALHAPKSDAIQSCFICITS